MVLRSDVHRRVTSSNEAFPIKPLSTRGFFMFGISSADTWYARCAVTDFQARLLRDSILALVTCCQVSLNSSPASLDIRTATGTVTLDTWDKAELFLKLARIGMFKGH